MRMSSGKGRKSRQERSVSKMGDKNYTGNMLVVPK